MFNISGNDKLETESTTSLWEKGLKTFGDVVKASVKPAISTLMMVGGATFGYDIYENASSTQAQSKQMLLKKTTINTMDKDGIISFHCKTITGNDTIVKFTMISNFQGSHTHEGDPDVFTFSAYSDNFAHGASETRTSLNKDLALEDPTNGINLKSTTNNGWILNTERYLELSTEGDFEKRAALVGRLAQFAAIQEKITGEKHGWLFNKDGRVTKTQTQIMQEMKEAKNHGLEYNPDESSKFGVYLRLVKPETPKAR